MRSRARSGWTHFGLTLRTTLKSFHRRAHTLALVNANISAAGVREAGADSEWIAGPELDGPHCIPGQSWNIERSALVTRAQGHCRETEENAES
ncbi:hypothetical protein KM043_007077 [Ampulex compressa]|nr:hypothetical protein KM043_007077 [Ampulex compressa]